MTRQRSEPVFTVAVKHSATPAGTGGTPTSVPFATASAAVRAAREEVRVYQANVNAEAASAIVTDPQAKAKLIGAEERLAAREKELDLARKTLGPATPATPPRPNPAGSPPSDLEDITLSVLSFEYQDDEKKVDLLKLTLNNSDLRHLDHPILTKGTQLVVSWGYPGQMSPERLCIVQKVTGWLALTVEAQDKGVLAQKITKSRTFENVTRSDVARLVARELGYADAQIEIEPTTLVLDVVTQAAQTDAQFLKKIADLEGFEFFVDFDGFHWHPRRTAQAPIRKLTYFVPPGVGDLISLTLDTDAQGKKGAVTQAGRDPLAKTDIRATANGDNTKRDTTAAKQEIPAPPPAVTYTQKVDPATGQIVTTYTKPPGTASDGVAAATTSPTAAKTAADAQKQAGGAFTTSQQSAVKLSGEMVGDPFIAAKTIVEIDGIGQRLSGRYYLTSVTHKIDGSGYKTTFKSQTDGTGKGSGGQGKGAAPNKKDPPPDPKNTPADPPAPLTMVEIVDPATGKKTIEYRNAQGKVPT